MEGGDVKINEIRCVFGITKEFFLLSAHGRTLSHFAIPPLGVV